MCCACPNPSDAEANLLAMGKKVLEGGPCVVFAAALWRNKKALITKQLEQKIGRSKQRRLLFFTKIQQGDIFKTKKPGKMPGLVDCSQKTNFQ